MSYGKPDDRALSTSRFHRLMANADADRTARSAGRKSPFRRLLDRLRSHHQDPGGDPQSNYGTTDDPPH